MNPEAEGSVAQMILVDKARETKSAYFWCKLAEGRIKIFRVVKLRGTKQICILSRGAERNVAHILLGQRG